MNRKTILGLVGVLALGIILIGSGDRDTFIVSNGEFDELKVAFIGDQGLTEESREVLELIRDEGADMVLHQGDFDYKDNPDSWDEQINEVLGEDFPYFASVGNHDVGRWRDYQEKLENRLERISGAECVGDFGVKSACSYNGFYFLLLGIGTKGFFHEEFARNHLENNNFTWKVCSFHKPQDFMHIGTRRDYVGWDVYRICREAGAIIATGHEHSYSRTYLMENFEEKEVASKTKVLKMEKGKSFAFVSGLGGQSIGAQGEESKEDDFWASIYTSDQGADYGALFCEFVGNKADCYFKDINGVVADEFELEFATS
tara:strand:+ start:219 stop:1163 length:945 start_codon:yes stop_codon:yes gene_type:complete